VAKFFSENSNSRMSAASSSSIEKFAEFSTRKKSQRGRGLGLSSRLQARETIDRPEMVK
jgi:hypothetical protein